MTIEESQFNELVSSVKNTLQSDGTLDKIKAQLRASVIKVLEPAKNTVKSTRSDIEIQALQVIHECLQALDANATLDVFLVETNFKNLSKKEYQYDIKNPLLYKLLENRRISESVALSGDLAPNVTFNTANAAVNDVKSIELTTDSMYESKGLSSLKGLPPLPQKKDSVEVPLTDIDKIDQDSDIIETFDVISNDSEVASGSKPMIDSQEPSEKDLNEILNDFTADEVQQRSNTSILNSVQSKNAIEDSTPSLAKQESKEIGGLKGLAPLKLAPLTRELPPIDSFKKPNLTQLNKDLLENQLEKDPELQETFNRLQSDSMEAAGVVPLDLTEDYSFEEDINAEDISEIQTTDRSISPRFISSVAGHDFVEQIRP